MSKFHCPCGWVISDTTFPCTEKSHVISDDDLDAVTYYSPDKIDLKGFNKRQRNMLICSRCERIHLQKTSYVNEYTTYAKEIDDTHVVKLEAALAQLLLYSYESDPWYKEARETAEKLLKR